jgi:hypothetical protein
MRNQSTGFLFFFLTDGHRQISRLEQDPILSLWKNTPFFIPSLNENILFTHVSFTAADDTPLTNIELHQGGCQLLLMDVTSVLVQMGLSYTQIVKALSPLSFLPKTSLCTLLPSMIYMPGQTVLNGQSFQIDPATKIHASLPKIQLGDDLNNAKTQSSKNVVDRDTISKDHMDKATTAISQMHTPVTGGNISEMALRVASGKLKIVLICLNVSYDVLKMI